MLFYKIIIPLLLILSSKLSNSQENKLLVIDPGHYYCPGDEDKSQKCIKKKYRRTHTEIQTNLDVALKLDSLLDNCSLDVKLTRTKANHKGILTLMQRATKAKNADLFLSIHCNGGGGTGNETFWCARYDFNNGEDSEIFAKKIHNKIGDIKNWNKRKNLCEGNDYLGFHLGVLSPLTIPGALSEIGFVDSKYDEEKLVNSKWQTKFAKAYYSVVHEFLGLKCHTIN